MCRILILFIILYTNLLYAEQAVSITYAQGPSVEYSRNELKRVCGQDLVCDSAKEKRDLIKLQERVKTKDLTTFKRMMEKLPLPTRKKFLKEVFSVNENYQIIGDFNSFDEWQAQSSINFNNFLKSEEEINELIDSYKGSPKIDKEAFLNSANAYQKASLQHGINAAYCFRYIEDTARRAQCFAKEKYPSISSIPFMPSISGSTPKECTNFEEQIKALDEKIKEYTEGGIIHRYVKEIKAQEAKLSRCINWCNKRIKEKYPYACSFKVKISQDSEKPADFSFDESSSFFSEERCQEIFDETFVSPEQVYISECNSNLGIFKSETESLIGVVEHAIEELSDDRREYLDRFKDYNPHKMTPRKIPQLIRMSAIGQSLHAFCDLTGQKIDPPLSCSKYATNIDKFVCTKKPIPQKSNKANKEKIGQMITASKNIKNLYKNREFLSDRITTILNFIRPMVGANPRFDNSSEFVKILEKYNFDEFTISRIKQDPSFNDWRKSYNFLNDLMKQYQELINQIDRQILNHTKENPFLFSETKRDAPIEEQNIENLTIIGKLSQMDPNKIDNNEYEKAIQKTQTASKEAFEKFLSNICDSENGIKDYQLLRMKEFTDPLLRSFPSLTMTHYCLSSLPNPDDVMDSVTNTLYYGGMAICLGAAFGPQGAIVGGVCGLAFTGFEANRYYTEKENFSELIDCRVSTGDKTTCTDAAYIKGKKQLEDAWGSLQLSLLMLPLDVLAPSFLKDVKGIFVSAKLNPEEAAKVAKVIQQRASEISKISDEAIKATRAQELVDDIEELRRLNYELLDPPAVQTIQSELLRPKDRLFKRVADTDHTFELIEESRLSVFPNADIRFYKTSTKTYKLSFKSTDGLKHEVSVVIPQELNHTYFSILKAKSQNPILQSVTPENFHEVLTSQVQEVLRSMPVDVLKHTPEIRINPSFAREDARVMGTAIDGRVRSRLDRMGYQHQSIDIYIYGWVQTPSTVKEVFYHELGHSLAMSVYGRANPDDLYRLAKESGPSISRYGEESLSEDFAEGIRVYLASEGGVTNPELLRKYAQRFKIFDDILKMDITKRQRVLRSIKLRMHRKEIFWGATLAGGSATISYIATKRKD